MRFCFIVIETQIFFWSQLKTNMFKLQSIFTASVPSLHSFYPQKILTVVLSPVGWGYRIHRLHLCRRVRLPQRVSWLYDTQQSDDEASEILELWGMRNTSSFPSLPGPLRPRVVAPDRVLSMGQIEQNCVLMLNWIIWNRTAYTYKNRFGTKSPMP